MHKFKEVAPALFKNGYEPLPIKVGEKRPAVDDWADVELTKDLLRTWYSNGVAQGGAGIRLGNGVVALDVDVDDPELSEIVQAEAGMLLGFAPVRVGQAPRCAMLYRCASAVRKSVLKLTDPLGETHKVELLGKGQQVVAYGIHPDTSAPYTWDDESPLDTAVEDLPSIDAEQITSLFAAIVDALPEGWSVSGKVSAQVTTDDDLVAFVENNPDRLDMTDEEVEEAIGIYSVPEDYDGWFRFMVACYHQSGGSEKGRLWAHTGCQMLDGYNPKEIDAKWNSGTLRATGDRKPVTFASVMSEVNEKRKGLATTESIDLFDKIKAKVQGADEKTLRTDLISKIIKAPLDEFDREQVAKIVQGRLKELTGTSVSIATVRKMLKPSPGSATRADSPAWCADWVYINSHDAMFSLDDHQTYKFSGFNLKCGHHVPMSENGAKPSAVKFVSDGGYVETVDAMAYLPGVSDALCTLDNGTRVVNSFNPNSVPSACRTISDDGQVAIDVIRRHLRVLCENQENSGILEEWLAHQVQHPGVKVLFAPLIQSIQGVGKSFIAQLLSNALGEQNVGVVNPSQVISENNGWATGRVVNILEELKISGHNRHEAANALKPLITDPYIQIQDKWVKAHKVYNTANYMCFTNWRDAVPLEDGDRRWWIIFCELESLEDIGKDFGLSRTEYFDQLWTALRGHAGCIRRWLLDYQISPEFKALKKAPDTIYKRAMVATERANVPFMDELMELIKEGGPNYNRDVICSADLFAAAEFEIDGFEANTSQRNLLLKRMGYTQLSDRFRIDGKVKRVWTKKVLTPEQARDLLHPVPF